jgi:hypothetical protein
MSQVAPNPEELRRVAKVAVDEVVEDAIKLLELYHRLQQAEPDSEAFDELRVDLEAQITTLRVHAQSAEEIFEEMLDALPDDAE